MGNLYTQDHFRLAVTEKGSVAESRGDCTLRLPDVNAQLSMSAQFLFKQLLAVTIPSLINHLLF